VRLCQFFYVFGRIHGIRCLRAVAHKQRGRHSRIGPPRLDGEAPRPALRGGRIAPPVRSCWPGKPHA